MTRTITIDHAGNQYTGKIMTIESTQLGAEDHGIFTAFLHCKGDGSGIGVGGYGLDKPAPERSSERQPTAYGMAHIAAIMKTAGVHKWEDLPGTDIIVLFEGKNWLGRVAVGFAGLINDRVLIFKEHADRFNPETGAAK